MITFHQFKSLPFEAQLDEMAKDAVSLDLFITRQHCEIALFSLNDFYVELHVQRYTDEINGVSSFKSLQKLDAYLHQVNIDEIKSALLN